MNILSISTASKSTLISIFYQGKFITRALEFSKHSENLFPLLIDTLEKNDLTLADFDAFGCVIGPGSFTGIRIGLSVVKGFAFALEKPIIAINSLELLAYNEIDNAVDKPILSVINAGAGLVYYQTFAHNLGRLNPLSQPKLDKFEHFVDYLNTEWKDKAQVVYSQNSEKGEDYSTVLGESQDFRLDSLGKAIKSKADEGKFLDAVTVSPLYLRPSQAENNVADLKFSKLSSVDISAIMQLESEHDDFDLEWSEVATLQSMDNPNFTCYGISNNMEMLGFISVMNSSDEVEILRIKVRKKARLIGIGTRLINKVIELSRQNGAKRILLEVNAHNYPAHRMYQKLGFVEVGRRHKYYNNHDDAILMNMVLD